MFLRAKHWQIFVLVVAPFILSGYLIGPSNNLHSIAIESARILYFSYFWGWLWVIASACYAALPDKLKVPVLPIKLSLVVILLDFVYEAIFVEPGEIIPGAFVVVSMFVILALVLVFAYTANQIAKLEQLKTASSSFSKVFLSLWVFPIGIWYLQPKVNRLLGDCNG